MWAGNLCKYFPLEPSEKKQKFPILPPLELYFFHILCYTEPDLPTL